MPRVRGPHVIEDKPRHITTSHVILDPNTGVNLIIFLSNDTAKVSPISPEIEAEIFYVDVIYIGVAIHENLKETFRCPIKNVLES